MDIRIGFVVPRPSNTPISTGDHAKAMLATRANCRKVVANEMATGSWTNRLTRIGVQYSALRAITAETRATPAINITVAFFRGPRYRLLYSSRL